MRYFIYLDDKYNIGMIVNSVEEPEVTGFFEITETESAQTCKFSKFNPVTREFYDEISYTPYIDEHEVIINNINTNITETKGITAMTSEDSLTIMEYQTVLDEKLSKIITHLGI